MPVREREESQRDRAKSDEGVGSKAMGGSVL